jgi:hypothetical protein
MAFKTVTNFKKPAIIGVALLGLLAGENWAAGGQPSHLYTVIVAQNETQTATNDKDESSPEVKEREINTDEKKESAGAEEKPLKDFQPSEKIEADQAVDFPYDI